jgi:hypothetical protein
MRCGLEEESWCGVVVRCGLEEASCRGVVVRCCGGEMRAGGGDLVWCDEEVVWL